MSMWQNKHKSLGEAYSHFLQREAHMVIIIIEETPRTSGIT
jgi:hypothetical protein